MNKTKVNVIERELEKEKFKFSLGLVHIVELCWQFLPLLLGVSLSTFGSCKQELSI